MWRRVSKALINTAISRQSQNRGIKPLLLATSNASTYIHALCLQNLEVARAWSVSALPILQKLTQKWTYCMSIICCYEWWEVDFRYFRERSFLETFSEAQSYPLYRRLIPGACYATLHSQKLFISGLASLKEPRNAVMPGIRWPI